MTGRRAWGVALPGDLPARETVALAREAEALGYDNVWVNDDRLQRDPIALLSAIAGATSRVALGPGVTNPYTRHPALLASAVATLDELSGGRAVLGLGTGGTGHRPLGVRRDAPAAALREAVAVARGLLAGEEVTLDGRVVRTDGARLDFAPFRADVPIYVGARGPRLLEVAGEVADGVIVGNLATAEGWSYATGRIARGAARAGRRLADVRLVAWFYCCVADDPDAALDAIRPMVATSLATSRPILGELGVELPGRYADAMEARGWSLDRAAVTAAGKLLPEDVLQRFGLAGTPGHCRAALARLLAAFPEIDQVVIVPYAPPGGGEVRDTLARFHAEVATRTEVAASRTEARRPGARAGSP
ncbi:LLM class flavin-dependent oxidoreductase [Actinomadura sp. 3N508]|uniref:LLM class flavin-dependent oxidoreductase n=1 Tax=Actinomadura sp. 3N508 TaxID=3375153 RepID=UPI00379B7A6A